MISDIVAQDVLRIADSIVYMFPNYVVEVVMKKAMLQIKNSSVCLSMYSYYVSWMNEVVYLHHNSVV
jgi:hypothetical protein